MISSVRKYIRRDHRLIVCLMVAWILLWFSLQAPSLTAISTAVSPTDFIHAVRVFLPFIVMSVSIVVILFSRSFKYLVTNQVISPLGFLVLYGLIGVWSAFFSPDLVVSLRWVIFYLSVPLILFAMAVGSQRFYYLGNIINLNSVLVFTAFFALLIFSLMFLDVGQRFMKPWSLLQCDGVGSWFVTSSGYIRSTGVGRFAALAALLSICMITRKNWRFLGLIILFPALGLLITTGARTSMIAFAAAVMVIACLMVNKKTFFRVVILIVVTGTLLSFAGIPQNFLNTCILRAYDVTGIYSLNMKSPPSKEGQPESKEIATTIADPSPILESYSGTQNSILSKENSLIVSEQSSKSIVSHNDQLSESSQNEDDALSIFADPEVISPLEIYLPDTPIQRQLLTPSAKPGSIDRKSDADNLVMNHLIEPEASSIIAADAMTEVGIKIKEKDRKANESLRVDQQNSDSNLTQGLSGRDVGDLNPVVSGQSNAEVQSIRPTLIVDVDSPDELQLVNEVSVDTELKEDAVQDAIGTSTQSDVGFIEGSRPERDDKEFLPKDLLPKDFLKLSGRTEIWARGWEFIKLSPFTGYGFHADRLVLGTHMHNSVMHSLIQTGFPGAILFCLALIYSWILVANVLKNIHSFSSKQRFLVVQTTAVIVFFSVRTLVESTGAFFGIDWLLLAPYLMYLQLIKSDIYISK